MSLLVERFLIRNNYTDFNKKDVSFQLQTHPQNPSFKAITDTLDYFGIENVAANVPENSLSSMPVDFLTLINQDREELVLATKKDDFVYVSNAEGQKEKYTTSDFNKIWGKKIIAIEKTAKASSAKTLKALGVSVILALLVSVLHFKEATLLQSVILLLSSIGVYLSYLLVKEKVGYYSPTVHSICTSSAKSNCDEVINSKGGMLTRNISLADASFLYFAILVSQNIFFISSNITSLLILLSAPVVIFSIYYQAIVLKKWCPLCLGVVLVLIMLNIFSYTSLSFSFSALEISEFLLIIVFLTPSYFAVKKLIIVNKNYEDEIISLRRFKREPKVIKGFMEEANKIKDFDRIENEVRIGNPEASNKIIVFTNPYCGYCKPAFESYIRLIKVHGNVEICVRFSSNPEDHKTPATKISTRLIELYFENGQEEFINAYLYWFKNKEEKDWLRKYGYPKFEVKTMTLLNKHNQWALNNSIEYTPATIIEGEEFPSSYGYEDLPYVLDEILKYQSEKLKI